MEKNINEIIEKYKLSKEEHNKVFELLKNDLFKNKIMEKKPSIMFVIGQPGCGKTTFINNTNLSNYTIINSDDYRHLSKYSKEILNKYPTDYAKLTNYDAHLWGDELFSYAIRNGYSVLREKAPIDYSLIDLIKTIPYSYDIVINVVVTGNLLSLLRTRERYERDVLKSTNAKLSNIESHNKCYDLLPDFISKCLSFGVKVNYVVSDGNKFKAILVVDNYLELLYKLREESNKQECLNYSKKMDNIKKQMLKRNAPQDQFVELEKIERIYQDTNNTYNIF